MKSLAIEYRPKTFEDVVEQNSTVLILKQQLKTDTVLHSYLFCGGAGTGKTTCARIFAKEINKGKGSPIEMDAASNSSVEDVRNIITQAKTQSLDSEYKVFIIDECHSISSQGWQAFLKLIEEPPAKSLFIFCTTDPQKIPKTILSRVQRYDFQRISCQGIIDRLKYILDIEKNKRDITYDNEAVEFISKIADGGMRDALTILDKCLAFSSDLTVMNVQKALGQVDFETMFSLTSAYLVRANKELIQIVEDIHRSGKDLKQFINSYLMFVIDLIKFAFFDSCDYIQIPSNYLRNIRDLYDLTYNRRFVDLMNLLLDMSNRIKWESSPKCLIEAMFISGEESKND